MSLDSFEARRAAWVEALLSGEYLQGFGALHVQTPRGLHKFCPLGVLADLYQREVGGLEVRRERGVDRSAVFFYDGSTDTPPQVVLDWVGLRTEFGGFYTDDGAYESVVYLNDTGSPFHRTGPLIRRAPEGLFL